MNWIQDWSNYKGRVYVKFFRMDPDYGYVLKEIKQGAAVSHDCGNMKIGVILKYAQIDEIKWFHPADVFPDLDEEQFEQHKQLVTLGKRAVACSRWRWADGMKTLSGVRITSTATTYDSGSAGEYDLGCEGGYLSSSNELPDLKDPATLGCLLALVRNVWRNNYAYPEEYVADHACDPTWVFRPGRDKGSVYYGMKEAEVLVAALGAAP
jgi:hypothetical protein